MLGHSPTLYPHALLMSHQIVIFIGLHIEELSLLRMSLRAVHMSAHTMLNNTKTHTYTHVFVQQLHS